MVRPAPTTTQAALALLGSGVAWAVHLLGSYAVVSVGCATGWWGTRPLLVAMTVACIVVAAASAIGAQRGREWSPAVTSKAAHFAFTVGAGLAGLFTALIALAGVVPFIVPLCVAG
jgi:hypothetical protein